MKNQIDRYIDNQIISEHALKSFRLGYSLDVDDLNEFEKNNFLDFLFKNDPATRDSILDRMQELIDMRLPIIELEDRYEAGFKPYVDQTNGEVTWSK